MYENQFSRNNPAESKTPAGKSPMLSPKSLTVTSGDIEGEVNLIWEPVKNAHSYVIQKCKVSRKVFRWMNEDIVPKSCYTLSKLKSSQKYWFRVAAVGKHGQGPWSEPVQKKAP